jgi:hypothetical protein
MQPQRHIGSIADYDPLNLIDGSSNRNRDYLTNQNLSNSFNSPTRQTNSTTNYANGSNNFSYVTNDNGYYYKYNDENLQEKYQIHQHQQQQQQRQQQYQINSIALTNLSNEIKTTVYRAIYDYDAKEDDEISFRDGDKFINCEQVDVGWMIGVHLPTGKHGKRLIVFFFYYYSIVQEALPFYFMDFLTIFLC